MPVALVHGRVCEQKIDGNWAANPSEGVPAVVW